jgi:HAE1 family hydrophobic/amphiphilic exporter-1
MAKSEANPHPTRDGGIAALFVRRPVLAVVLNLLIVIAGLAAWRGIEVRELPNIDRPVITVRTSYTGATPDTIDKEVTSVIEGAVARTPGVVSISSSSSAGQSQVTVEFDQKTDINVAANDLRDAIGNLRSLPTDDNFKPPTIVKADANSDAIMRLAVTSSTLSIQDLTRIVNDTIVTRLAAVDGVADVQVFGDRDPIVQIIIDPNALAAHGLTIADLNTALGDVTLDAPAGTISDANRTLLVRADASAKSAEEIGDVQINPQTRVSDVADVVFGPADKTTSLRIDGMTGVGLGIVRQARANTLDISAGVGKAIERWRSLPPGSPAIPRTMPSYRGAIHEVLITLLIASAIVIGIIYLFLQSLRATFIPAVTVPIALIGTLAAMWVVGFSINVLTLLALVLATGLVVDDAIVVIENISRQRSLGLGPRAAAVLGTRQVFLAVLATTATLAAVFIPISFFPGLTGSLFSEFGFVLAFAVTLSCVVALTLSPMLASRLIGDREAQHRHNAVGRRVAAFGERIIHLYARLLDAALKAPMVVIVAAVLFAGAAVAAFNLLPSELTPNEDRGFIPISISVPQGSTVDYTEAQMKLVEQAAAPLLKSGEATSIFAIARNNGNGGFMFLTLAPWGKRSRTQAEITSQINRELQQIPGVQVFARTANSLGIRGGGQGLQFAITGTDYDQLAGVADKLVQAMEKDPAFDRVQLNYDTTQPQMAIKIDRQRATDVGISVDTISAAVQTILSGKDLGNYYIGDDPIEILAKVPDGMVQDSSALDNLQLRTKDGKMVPLSSLVSFQESAVAPSLPRQDQRRAIPIGATLGEGIDLRQAMNELQTLAAGILPANNSLVFTGEAKELNSATSGVVQTFVFALVIVLLVLAGQFESFASAFILIATVPFGLAAAVFAILITHGSINIYSEIGLVMLVGLMSKNGILIVEFANQLRDAGQSVRDAVRNAALIRLRPVVMTMIATVLGGLPLVLRGGAGSEARHALGWVIVGGLGLATLATLFLTPVVYELLARFAKPRVAEEQRLTRELEDARAIGGGLTPTPEEEGEVTAEPAPAPAAAEERKASCPPYPC